MNGPRLAAIKKSSGSSGLTLVEVLIATGILGFVLAMTSAGVYRALAVERFWRDDVIATKELRNAWTRFAGDALNAQSIDLTDGAPPATSITMTWTGGDGTLQTVSYSVLGMELLRDKNGAQASIARRVTSIGFSLSGSVLTFDLGVEGASGNEETMSLDTYLRLLSP